VIRVVRTSYVLSKELMNAPVSIEIVDASGPPAIEASHLDLRVLSYDGRDGAFEVAVARRSRQLPLCVLRRLEHGSRRDRGSAPLIDVENPQSPSARAGSCERSPALASRYAANHEEMKHA
jgi:hypothetical protein